MKRFRKFVKYENKHGETLSSDTYTITEDNLSPYEKTWAQYAKLGDKLNYTITTAVKRIENIECIE